MVDMGILDDEAGGGGTESTAILFTAKIDAPEPSTIVPDRNRLHRKPS